MIAGGIFGILLERFCRPSFAATATSVGWMLTTIAVGVMIEALATLQFGGFSAAAAFAWVEERRPDFGAGVYPQELIIPVVAVLVMVGRS